MSSNIEGVKSHLGLNSPVCVSHLRQPLRAEAPGHVPIIPHSSEEERWGGRPGLSTPPQARLMAAAFQMTNCSSVQHLPEFPHTHMCVADASLFQTMMTLLFESEWSGSSGTVRERLSTAVCFFHSEKSVDAKSLMCFFFKTFCFGDNHLAKSIFHSNVMSGSLCPHDVEGLYATCYHLLTYFHYCMRISSKKTPKTKVEMRRSESNTPAGWSCCYTTLKHQHASLLCFPQNVEKREVQLIEVNQGAFSANCSCYAAHILQHLCVWVRMQNTDHWVDSLQARQLSCSLWRLCLLLKGSISIPCSQRPRVLLTA